MNKKRFAAAFGLGMVAFLGWITVKEGCDPGVRKVTHRQGFYEKYIKRPQDAVLAAVSLIGLSPVLALTAVLVRRNLGSPVLFTQMRPGLNGRLFKLYKFRTMTDERGRDGELCSDEARLTDFGRKLRETSMDELPELFNILKGDMSIVGPRPLLAEYLPRYSRHQARRHEVRPGLTGYAQVSGRNSVSWEEKLEKDVEYVDGVSFLSDWRIIFRTVAVVWKREGISGAHSATMEVFLGNHIEEKGEPYEQTADTGCLRPWESGG